MFSFLKKMLGGESVDIAGLISNGAKIIDVRTPSEFYSGHVKGSENIPLDSIGNKMSGKNKTDVYVLCCRSGTRSSMAVHKLKSMGFTNVHNGGSWTNVKTMKTK